MSRDGARPKNVHFVDVTVRDKKREPPAWLVAREDDAETDAEYPVSPLTPPEVPSHERPALAPLLESARPPAPRPPSQFPAARGRPGPASLTPTGLLSVPPPAHSPSQFPAGPGSPSQLPPGSIPPSLPPGMGASLGNAPPQHPSPDPALADPPLPSGLRRRDTLVEDLVPRAEEEAVQAIAAAIESFAEERAQALERAEKELVELVKVICRRVVLREVTLSSSVIESLVQEGLAALGRNDQVSVKLGPFFADALDHISDNLHHRGVQCTVTIDPSVGPHGCVLETALGRVDESVETRLNVLLASLDSVP